MITCALLTVAVCLVDIVQFALTFLDRIDSPSPMQQLILLGIGAATMAILTVAVEYAFLKPDASRQTIRNARIVTVVLSLGFAGLRTGELRQGDLSDLLVFAIAA